ncbi:hypothetical protein Fmac_018057 [Flemingia macrophylla]|uniref:Gnk2-homologous domain-containing protein n=1 Tax=Flemingia macrophylla TaxID=520843 RepID=A0ABD1M3W4_9FABA
MASNSFNLVFLCMFLAFYNSSTTKAEDPPSMFMYCEDNTTNTTYQTNLKTLLAILPSNAAATFHNETIETTVFGLFMCRGDVLGSLCTQCVENATTKLSSNTQCSHSKRGIIWYDECMVRFSNATFFSTITTVPAFCGSNIANVSTDETAFHRLLSAAMNETAAEAANSGNYYATAETSVSQTQTLYCMAQRTQDLTRGYCATCLSDAAKKLPECCEGKQGGGVSLPSCDVRYELYPFYRDLSSAPDRVIPINPPPHDSNSIPQPQSGYVSYNCSISRNDAVGSPTFESNLKSLLSELTSNATNVDAEFQMRVGALYGLFMCRHDLTRVACGECVANATNVLLSACGISSEGIVWYDRCLVRYACRDFFSKVETSPMYTDVVVETTEVRGPMREFATTLSNRLSDMANLTGGNGDRYWSETQTLNREQTLYIVSQCTKDLSSTDCDQCLNSIIGTAIPWRRLESSEGRVYYPSCVIRFKLSPFFNPTPPTSLQQPPPPLTPHQEPLQFDLAIIKAATNNFSHENHIGKGGFGEVYKVWRQWMGEKSLSILDPKSRENYCEIQVNKCIHIGMLCVQETPDARPTMLEIISYLSNHSIELPSPLKPAFVLRSKLIPKLTAHESSSSQSANDSIPFSVNEMSISEFYPR